MPETTVEKPANGNGPTFDTKDCLKCGRSFQPTGPRHLYCPTCKSARPEKKHAAPKRPPAQPQKPSHRERYVEILLTKAEAESPCSDELLDRIERLLEA